MTWAGHGKRQLKDLDVGRRKNIRMYLGKIGCGGIDWINVAQDKCQWWALANTEPLGSIKCLEILEWLHN
jgi:hypothetical protein